MVMGVYRSVAQRRSRSNQIEEFRRGHYSARVMEEGSQEVNTGWSAYSCPLCHAIFRLPAGSGGLQVECPSCGEAVTVRDIDARGSVMLDVTGTEAQVAGDAQMGKPSGQEFSKAELVEKKASKGIRKRKRRRRSISKRRRRSDNPEWDSEAPAASPGKAGKADRSSWKMVVYGGLSAVVLLAGVMILFLADQGNEGNSDSTSGELVRRAMLIEEQEEEEGDLVQELQASDMNFEVAGLTEAVERFLRSATVEELLAVTLRDRYQREKIREYYRTRTLSPLEPKAVAPGGRVVKNGNLWAADVILPDNSARPVTLRRSQDGYRVDWESWVGYSEMTWEEIRELRPVKPVTFRVLCSAVQYYNYGFTDESEWISYRLQSPDRKQALFGYAARPSEEAKRLLRYGDEEGKPRAFILRIRFAEDSGPDQVIIDEVVSTGWSAVGSGFGFPDAPPKTE